MREMAVDARVLALGMGRGWGPVSAAPLALQQNILTAFHLDQDAGDAVQAVQEVLNPAAGFSDDVVHDDQGAFPGRLGNGGGGGLADQNWPETALPGRCPAHDEETGDC